MIPELVVGSDRVIALRGRSVHLSRIEFEIFTYLLSRQKRICTAESIIAWVYQLRDLPKSDTFPVHLFRLRRRIAPLGLAIHYLVEENSYRLYGPGVTVKPLASGYSSVSHLEGVAA